ncbi:MAG TPA: adenosine deaminase [Thermoanaerobaculia bacterium]|nr:adenosine deaminase [Thermoanaerobaculia bacterium]
MRAAAEAPSRRRRLAAFLAELPKAELHVHLEGSIAPGTLLRLARRHGVELPARDEAGLAEWFRFRDFPHFVEVYLTCSRCLRDPEDFHTLCLDFLAEQARQRIVWSEVHFTISTHLANGGDGEAIRQALSAAAEEGARRWGVRLGLIPDIVRNAPAERADWTVEWILGSPPSRPASAGATGAVLALGLAGMEAGFPPDPFAPHFEAVAGYRRVAHAGEHAGPDSVWRALDVLGAERIGHGVRSIEDPALVAELARRRVPLEVCPTSNLRLGVYPDLAAHPIARLRQAGVPLSVGSDDPPLFGTTLTGELLDLAETFGWQEAELAELVAAAWEQSFLPEAEKQAWVEQVRQTPVPLRSPLPPPGGRGPG